MEVNFPLKVNFRYLGYYIFILILFFLARSYLGSFFIFLFYLVFFTPLFSLLYLIVSHLFVRYSQNFSNEHPVKGETVKYTLIISNESPFPIPMINVHFKLIHPYLERLTEDFSAYLLKGEKLKREYVIKCPYRGVYTIGLHRIVYEDLLGLFKISRSIWYRTFYVYPRIITLKGFPLALRRGMAEKQTAGSGIVPDTTLFTGLRDYRRGESLRHVYWKKFASTGKPFIKEYGISTEPSVSIYLDLRKEGISGVKALIAEDISVEILIALANHFLESGISINIFIAGKNPITVQNRSDFNKLYKSTILIKFRNTVSPLKMFGFHWQYDTGLAGMVFITHVMDSKLFDMAGESAYAKRASLIVFNLSGCRRIGETEHHLNRLIDRGARILAVHNSKMIAEDLKRDV